MKTSLREGRSGSCQPWGRQRGSVMVMAGFALVVLIAFAGLVLDLGQTYVRKSELQNAADAAALAGARELNGTKAGVDLAVTKAIAVAQLNKSDFDATPVAITTSNIRFGPSANGPWQAASSVADDAAAASLYFVEINTSGLAQGTRPTWFMGALNSALATTTASAYAVAGHTQCKAMPIFTCANGPAPNYGYTPGQTYFLAQPPSGSPIGPGNIGWMDPAPYGSSSVITGANQMRDILCRGKNFCMSGTGTYTSLTQSSLPEMMKALNTRFGTYSAPLNDNDIKLACPADRNVKEYDYQAPLSSGGPKDWMNPDPTTQDAVTGVRWSGVPPTGSDTSLVENYPSGGGTPYSQTSSSQYPQYFKAPTGALATSENRRILTIGLASNCSAISGSNKPVNLVAFANFLLPVRADTSGSTKGFFGEFLGTTSADPAVVAEVRLYR